MSRPLLTVKDAAERLATSERFVRRLIFERRISYTKLGGRHVRIAEDDLEAFIAAGRVEPNARETGGTVSPPTAVTRLTRSRQ